MSYIPVRLRRQVIARAGNRCEYCRLSQLGQIAQFHIDHIQPQSAGGLTLSDNLALACVACSLHKAARQSFIDPISGRDVPLFNPRQMNWSDHFRWDDVLVQGLTPIGRATIAALQMNRVMMLAIREEQIWFGRHPG